MAAVTCRDDGALAKVIFRSREAVGLVKDGDTVLIGGSGAGHALPQKFIDRAGGRLHRAGRAATT